VLTECVEMASGKANPEDEFRIWKHLQTIFVDIDQTYNGGLFSPQESEFTVFIEDHRIANTYLGPAINNLNTYEEKGGGVKRISYRDLGVRHLGTLYEGLLEHKLYIAEEDTEVRKSKGKLRFIPVSQGGKIKVGNHVPAGRVYFAGDTDERKSTGSYYTPEDIVDYIARNTVGEKLKELRDAYMVEQHENYQAYQRVLHEDEKHRLARLVEERTLEFVHKRVLKLSVLDPAMGSGHFLVNATNLIANFITELMNTLGIKGETETSTATWRRWVVENCIYGVDINPLAVELTKLSLWILSMAKEQPLSFLNHHLKCGDSLVGARLNEIGFYPGIDTDSGENARQLSMFETDKIFRDTVRKVISSYRMIESEKTTSLAQVEVKKELLEQIDEALKPYKQICDLHMSIYFGNEVDELQYQEIVDTKFIPSQIINFEGDENSYFHWELEFPEVLSGTKIGFDCIIGNPPYDVFKPDNYLNNEYGIIFYGRPNLWQVFLYKGLYLINSDGLITMIIPKTFLTDAYCQSIRRYIYDKANVKLIIDILDRHNTFPGVLQACIIASFSNKSKNNVTLLGSVLRPKNLIEDFKKISVNSKKIFIGKYPEIKILHTTNKDFFSIFEKVYEKSIPLKKLGCKAKTGPIQWDRYPSKLSPIQINNSLLLLWAENVQRYNIRPAR